MILKYTYDTKILVISIPVCIIISGHLFYISNQFYVAFRGKPEWSTFQETSLRVKKD